MTATKSNISFLADIRDALGSATAFRIKPYETIQSVTISPDWNTVVVLVDTFEIDDRSAKEDRLTRHGIKLVQWKRAFATGWKTSEVIAWDEEAPVSTVVKYGKSVTPAEYAARRRWEGDCYRVGSPNSPMDSCARTLEGYSPMADSNYWK